MKDYAAFKILGILFLAGVLLSNYIGWKSVQSFNDNVSTPGISSVFRPYAFDYTWQSTSWVSGLLLIIPAMLIIILVTNEFSFKTNRQNIIDGWSRAQFINVKIVIAAIFALISTVMVIITALLFGLISGDDFSLDKFENVFYFLLKAFTYNMVGLLFSVLIRRTGFAIGIFFIYLGAENLISQLLNVWSIYLRNTKDIDLGSLGDYLPMNASDGLLSFPDNPLKSMARAAMPSDYTMLVLGFAVAYILLFIWWSRKKIMNSDL